MECPRLYLSEVPSGIVSSVDSHLDFELLSSQQCVILDGPAVASTARLAESPVATGTVRNMVGGGPSRNFQVFILGTLSLLDMVSPQNVEDIIT